MVSINIIDIEGCCDKITQILKKKKILIRGDDKLGYE